MAKAKQVACSDQASDPQKWLADLLNLRFEEVLSQRGAALDPVNIEGVHGMRVAIRRLRGALSDFDEIVDCREIKRVRKGLKNLADELGDVRGHDVAIAALEKLLGDAENSRVRDGIQVFIEERRAARDDEYRDLLKVISIISIEDLQKKFVSGVNSALSQRGLFQPASLTEAGRDGIAARLQEIAELGTRIYEPFNPKALHKLRIASKHLRYAIELFGTCWNGTLDPFAEEVAKMQSALGEVHDCDEWIALMSKRLKKKDENKLKDGSYEAAAWLLSEFVRKRSKEYRSALDRWSEWTTSGFVERLRTAISK